MLERHRHLARRLEAILGIARQGGHRDCVDRGGDLGAVVARSLERAAQDLLHEDVLAVVLPHEEAPPGEKLPENDPR